jgi:hypothetical protein
MNFVHKALPSPLSRSETVRFPLFLHLVGVADVFGSRPKGDTAEMIGTQKLIAPVMKQFGADFLAYQVCSILRCASSTTIPDSSSSRLLLLIFDDAHAFDSIVISTTSY